MLFSTQISMTCWKWISSPVCLSLEFSPRLEVRCAWQLACGLVGSWRAGQSEAVGAPSFPRLLCSLESTYVDCAHCSLVKVGLTSGPEPRKKEKVELLKQKEGPDEQKEQTNYCSGVIGICLHCSWSHLMNTTCALPLPSLRLPSWVRAYTSTCLFRGAVWIHVCLSGSRSIASAFSFMT